MIGYILKRAPDTQLSMRKVKMYDKTGFEEYYYFVIYIKFSS